MVRLYNPFVLTILLCIYFRMLYIIEMFLREKILECTVRVKELFQNQEDALKNEKEGKVVSVDLLNIKFVRNNIKLFDDTSTDSSKNQGQKSETSKLGTGV